VARSLSSQKRLRQSETRAECNRQHKSQIKTAIRRVTDAVHDKNSEKAQSALRFACKLLDRNGNRDIIHPNKAARKKGQLMRMVNGLSSAS
jgi:small subunit ribosomal protein S20